MRKYGECYMNSWLSDWRYSMIREGLTFDDVLMVPKYSTVKSRSTDVDTSVKLSNFKFKHPIIPANMKTITGPCMAIAVAESGGLAILHRFIPFEEQLLIAEDMIEEYNHVNKFAVSIGVKKEDRQHVDQFFELGVRIFCIDIAHGDSEQCVEMCSWIKGEYPEIFLIAGNVATGSGAERLWRAGANVVKVGIGPGSLCTTRLETGNGVPQLSALMDVAQTQKIMLKQAQAKGSYREYPFISDGGIKHAGDIVKALAFADMVMIGNLFAGCEETPGQILSIDGKSFKEYVGSSTHKTNHIEGIAAIVPTKGNFNEILAKLLEGLTSGCSYQGSHNLTELKNNPEFIRITNSGLKESQPHILT
jgi:IMP dehydrogenase